MGSERKQKHARQIYIIFRKDRGEHETVAGYCHQNAAHLPESL